jgi:predicted permease
VTGLQAFTTAVVAVLYVSAWAAVIFATDFVLDSPRLGLAFYIGSHLLTGFAIGRPSAAWLVLVAALMALVPGAGLLVLVILWALFAVLLVWAGVAARRLMSSTGSAVSDARTRRAPRGRPIRAPPGPSHP